MNNSSFSSLLKAHLQKLDKRSLNGSSETHAWYQSHSQKIQPPSPPSQPPPPAKQTAPISIPKIIPPPKTQRSGFALNPKKELQSSVPKTLLEQLKESVEGVTFFEEPPLPKKVLLLCKEEEKPLVEKLAQAIDQKILPCKVGTEILEDHLIIAAQPAEGAIYILPPLHQLQELAVKQQVWKEIKECLSKYC